MVKGHFVFNLVIYTLVIAYILYINLSSYYNYNTSFLNSIVNLFQNWIFRAIFLLIVGFFALDLFPYGGFILAVLLTIAFLNTSMLMYKRHISEQFANQVMGSNALLAQALGRGENDGQHYIKSYEGAPINTNETFDGGYNQEDFADGDYEDEDDGQENYANDGEDYGDEDAEVDGQEDYADEDEEDEEDGQEDFANEDDYEDEDDGQENFANEDDYEDEDDGQENFANEDDYEDDGQEDFANEDEDDYEDDGQEDFANEDDEDAQLEEDVIRAMGLDPNETFTDCMKKEKFTDCMKKEKFTNRTVNSRENCGPYAPLQRLPFNPQGYMDNTGLMGACAPDDLPEDDDMDGVYSLSGIGYNFNMA